MKFNAENVLLAVFVIILLFVGPGVLMNHELHHDHPYGYSASDAFQHQVRAESIKDMGGFRYEASYIAIGLEETVGRYPPILYHLAVILGEAAGLEVYDSIAFLILFFMIIGVVIMFFIIKNFNRHVALLSLPLTILMFGNPIIGGFRWGHWPSLLGQSFLVLFFWMVMKRKLPHSWIFLGLTFSAIALTHTAQSIFAVLFLGAYFVILILFGKLTSHDFKNGIFMGLLFVVISFYYLIIFKNTWASGGGGISLGTSMPFWDGGPGFYFGMFGLLLLPLLVGLAFSVLYVKKNPLIFVVGWVMLIAGFLNYVGFSFRSFQVRFFWPLYLSIFFGFGIYIIGKFLIKKWKYPYVIGIFGLFILIVLGLFPFPNSLIGNPQDVKISTILGGSAQYNGKPNPGMMSQFHWQTFNWVSEKTPPEAVVYFFYGDIYDQDATLRNAKRTHHQVNIEDFVKSIQERKIKREYMTEIPGDTGGGISYRKSFFSFEFASESLPKNYQFQSRDVCNYDYWVFDKVSRQQALAQYNLLIAQKLIQSNMTTPVFENEVAIIIQNNNKGGDCIEDTTF